MNINSSISTAAPIQINETFLPLIDGAAAIRDVAAERRQALAAQLAQEDSYARRRREQRDLLEAFQVSLGYRDLITEL